MTYRIAQSKLNEDSPLIQNSPSIREKTTFLLFGGISRFKNLNPMVSPIDHMDPALTIHSEIGGTIELTGIFSFDSPFCDETTFSGKLLNAVIVKIRHKNPPLFTDGYS